MKHTTHFLLAVFLVAHLHSGLVNAFATELKLGFSLGNQEFAPDRNVTNTEIETDVYLAGFEISGVSGLPFGLRLHYGLERDLRLRTLGYLGLGYADDRVFFSVTPTAGLLNSSGLPVSPGVRSSIGFYIFDRGELEFSLMRPFFTKLSSEGDNNQSSDKVSGALYFKEYLIGGQWSRRIYREREAEFLRVSQVTEYALYTEIFQKNVPYSVTLRLSYQDRVLEFDGLKAEARTGSVVFGPSLRLEPSPGLTTYTGISVAVFTLGREDLSGQSVGDEFLYTMHLGLGLDLQRLSRTR